MIVVGRGLIVHVLCVTEAGLLHTAVNRTSRDDEELGVKEELDATKATSVILWKTHIQTISIIIY